jgi:hypothetical protein
MELMRAEIAGPNPSPLERLLVERIIAGWLFLHMMESGYQRQFEHDLKLGDYMQKQIDRVHRRYLAAIRQLAMIRKMALPVLEVKIRSTMTQGIERAAHEVSGL